MSNGRVHFFVPKENVDSEVQTYFEFTPAHKGTLSGRIHTEALSSLLFQESHATTAIDRSLVESYSSRLAYFLAHLHDERFEILTPPSNLYEALPLSAIFELHEDRFLVMSNDTLRSVWLNYDERAMSLLESFETGLVSPELYSLLEALQSTVFEEGNAIIHVIDFRTTPEKVFRLKLSVGECLLRFCLDKDKPARDVAVDVESTAVLTVNPTICTDPSPDVARAFSNLDFRAKMWRLPKRSKQSPPARPSSIVATVGKADPIELQPLVDPIRIPDAIAQLMANLERQAKSTR
jgi:hypothetical protein